MRKGQRWLTVIFIAVIGGVFVFFMGTGAPLTNPGPSGNAIIQAGHIQVFPSDYYRIREASQEQWQEQFGESLDTDAVQTMLETETLRRLTQDAILAHAATELGLQVTRDEIQSFALNLEGFRDEAGQFDQQAFESQVEYTYGSQRAFMDAIRQDFLREKLATLVLSVPEVSDAEAREAARRRLQAVRLGFVSLDAANLGDTATTGLNHIASSLKVLEGVEERATALLADSNARVKSLYEERADQYARPEARKSRYILVRVSPDASDEDRASARKRAEEIQQSILDGADFADVALERSDDESSRARGGDIGYIARGETRPEIEAALYAVEPGGETRLVETDAGFYIVRVDEIRPESQVPFEEASLEIARELALEELGQERAQALATGLSEAVSQGKSLEDAASDLGVPYQSSASLRRRPDGYLPGIGTSQELMAQAFAMNSENPRSGRVFKPGTKQVLIEWKATEEPRPEDLAAAVEVERERLLAAKRNQALQDWLDLHRQALEERGELLIDTSSVTNF